MAGMQRPSEPHAEEELQSPAACENFAIVTSVTALTALVTTW